MKTNYIQLISFSGAVNKREGMPLCIFVVCMIAIVMVLAPAGRGQRPAILTPALAMPAPP